MKLAMILPGDSKIQLVALDEFGNSYSGALDEFVPKKTISQAICFIPAGDRSMELRTMAREWWNRQNKSEDADMIFEIRTKDYAAVLNEAYNTVMGKNEQRDTYITLDAKKDENKRIQEEIRKKRKEKQYQENAAEMRRQHGTSNWWRCYRFP